MHYALSNEPKMNIVRYPLACQKWLKKCKTAFPSKIALRLRKVCYKVYLCEYCQRQSCKAFTGLSIHAKMVHAGRPLLRKNFADADPQPSIAPISNQSLLVAHQPQHLAKKFN